MKEFDNRAHAHKHIVGVMHADPLLQAGLKVLLEESKDWCVVQADLYGQLPDLLLTDHATAIALEPARLGSIPVLVVTNHERDWQVRAALEVGVRGYLLQSCGTEELLHAVTQLLNGCVYLSQQLTDNIAASYAKATLTRRETDVLCLLGEGICNKLIARKLNIGLGTVKSHVNHVMTKLGASARTEAVVIATRQGMISPDPGVRRYSPLTRTGKPEVRPLGGNWL